MLTALITVGGLLAAPAFAAAPTITSFTPTSGKLGTKVTITGTGFAAPATVTFGGGAHGNSTVVLSSTTITSQVPTSAASGPIAVTTPSGTATSSSSFTVVPGLFTQLSSAGPPGGNVTELFSGFSPYEAVDFYFDTTDLALVSASSTGSGSVTLTVPNSATPGTHWISAVGRHSGYSAQVSYTVRTDWPQEGFDGGHTSNNTSEHTLGAGNVSKLARVWRHALYPYAVSVAGGYAYAGTATGVTALNLATGAVKWTAATGPVYGAPAVSGSLVYAGDGNGTFWAFNATTGAQVWKSPGSADEITTAPVVANGLVYTEVDNTNTEQGALDAFNPAGSLVWSYGLGTECDGAAVVGTVLYDTCNDGTLIALDVSTTNPTELWAHDGSEYLPTSAPTVANGIVYVDGFNYDDEAPALFAFDADSGNLAWHQDFTENDGDDQLNALPSVADGQVYLRVETGGGDYLYAYSAATGRSRWTQPIGASTAPVTTANGLLYVASYYGLDVLAEATGALVTDLPSNGQQPIVTDAGLLLVVGQTPGLVRYALPQSAMSSARRPSPAALRPDRSLRRRT